MEKKSAQNRHTEWQSNIWRWVSVCARMCNVDDMDDMVHFSTFFLHLFTLKWSKFKIEIMSLHFSILFFVCRLRSIHIASLDRHLTFPFHIANRNRKTLTSIQENILSIYIFLLHAHTSRWWAEIRATI